MRWNNPLGILSLIVWCPLLSFSQHTEPSNNIRTATKYTIAGYIRDATAREALPGATVTVQHAAIGASSNTYGFYSLTLPAGTYTLHYGFIGHKTVAIDINLTADQRLDIELPEETIGLAEVVVSGTETPAQELSMSTHNITPETLRKIPSFAGSNDIIKALQWLPGVSTIGEGSTGLFVRGGGIDQNLILLDDAPVYNASHLLGFLSVFNEDAIKNARLHKSYFPIEHGGRLSSLLDIRMKEGNAKTFKAAGGIGILSGARIITEGPVKKGRGSYMLSARRTFAEPILLLTRIDSASNVQFKGTKLYFYDINAKLNYKLNSRNDLFLSTYAGRDVNKLPILDYNINWGNITSTLRWNHIFNNRLFSNVSFIYSNYDYNLSTPSAGKLFDWKSQINDVNMKANLTYYHSDALTWKFGINTILHAFRPGFNRSGNEAYSVPNRKALESAAYAGIEAKLTDHITTETGIRFSSFTNLGPTTIYRFNNGTPQDSTIYGKGQTFHTATAFEPRLMVNFRLDNQQAIKASYMRSVQYLQLLSNTSLSFTAFDVWYPSGPNIKPLTAEQYALGYFRGIPANGLQFSAEAYYKNIDNQTDYRDNAQLIFNPHLEGELLTGKAWAYGLELLLQKTTGKLTGMVGYTYARSKRKIPGINDGRPYPALYDQPHKITLTGHYEASTRLSFSASWVYNTGTPNNIPVESFQYDGRTVPVYAGRNNRRLPDYHRLDLSATIKGKDKPGKKTNHYVVFSIYNAYARKNPLAIYIGEDLSMNRDRNAPKTVANMAYLFSIVPTLSYNFILR